MKPDAVAYTVRCESCPKPVLWVTPSRNAAVDYALKHAIMTDHHARVEVTRKEE